MLRFHDDDTLGSVFLVYFSLFEHSQYLFMAHSRREQRVCRSPRTRLLSTLSLSFLWKFIPAASQRQAGFFSLGPFLPGLAHGLDGFS